MLSLKGKVVVITGAGDGLGKQIAFDLGKESVKLAIVAKTEKKLAAVKNIINKSGSICEYYICDVSDDIQVEKTAKKIIKDFGRVDILINNAGIYDEDDRLITNSKILRSLFYLL